MTGIHVAFTTPSGRMECEANDGESLMRLAVRSGVPGIIGECGGEMSCATCHVMVDDAWASELDPVGEEESEMLEAFDYDGGRSRLGCQIKLSARLDGLTVEVPEAEW